MEAADPARTVLELTAGTAALATLIEGMKRRIRHGHVER
jgi:hypothetical protein